MAQVDYSALADEVRKKHTQTASVSIPIAPATASVDYSKLADQVRQKHAGLMPTPGLGQYKMTTPDGKSQLSVSYDEVQRALESGYQLADNKEEDQYKRDLDWNAPHTSGRVPQWWESVRQYVQKKTAPTETPSTQHIPTSPIGRAFDPDTQAWGNFFKRVGGGLFGMVDFPVTLGQNLLDLTDKDPAIVEKAQHNLKHMLPVEMTEDRVAEFKKDWAKDHNTALNNLAADIATLGLAHKLGKADQAALNAMRDRVPGHGIVKGTARTLAGIRPRVAQSYVDDIMDRNQKVFEARDQLKARQALEAQIKDKTAKVFAADEAERVKAKAEADQKWVPWHNKVKDYKGPADDIIASVKKNGLNTSEVKRLMGQVKVDDADVVPDSQYYRDRDWAISQFKFPGNPKWSELNPDQVAQVKDHLSRLGIEPPAEELDLDEGGSLTLEQVHRAKSVLGQNLNKFEGMQAGEAKQVYGILDETERNWSQKAGAYDELMKGRAATKEYHEAFGLDKSPRRTKLSTRQKQTNPQAVKERAEADNLAAIAKRNPQLADEHKQIREMRKQLSQFATEKALLDRGKNLEEASNKGLQEAYRKTALGTLDYLRRRGIFYGGAAALGAFSAIAGFQFSHIFAEILGAALTLKGIDKFAEFMEDDKRIDWMTKPDLKDWENFISLRNAPRDIVPPEVKQQVLDAMKRAAGQAESRGIPVSPIIIDYLATQGVTSEQTNPPPTHEYNPFTDSIDELEQETPEEMPQ